VPDLAFLLELAAAHAGVTTTIWPEGDHNLPLTHPQACLAIIQDTASQATATMKR
jgi:pimeloyl-ACP methyl ester carboxylesterase